MIQLLFGRHFEDRVAASLDLVVQTESQLVLGGIRVGRGLGLRDVVRHEPNHERALGPDQDSLLAVQPVTVAAGRRRGQRVVRAEPDAAEEASPGPVAGLGGRGGRGPVQPHHLQPVREEDLARAGEVVAAVGRVRPEAILSTAAWDGKTLS